MKVKNTKATGISLSLKFFLLTAFIIILLIVVTLWFSSRKAMALANETLRSALKETLTAFDTFQSDRFTKLKLANTGIANNPYIQAYIAESDAASILDQAQQRQEEVKSDFMIVTDPEGTILARTDKPRAVGDSIADAPLVEAALEGEEASGLWVEGEKLYTAVALPTITADIITACLVSGYAIDESLASQLKSLTHSETAFFLNSGKTESTLIATTLAGMREDLAQALTRRTRGSTEPFQFTLGQETYIGVVRDLKNVDGKVLGGFIAFRSLDRELLGFKQFRDNIFYVGIGITVLAFLFSFLGTRRITGPLRHLTHAINEVKEGNYEVNIRVESTDEVGVLSESFRRLLAELKEKDMLVQYLSSHSTLSSTQAANAPTIGHHVQDSATIGGPSQYGTTTMANIGPGTVIANRYEVQSVLGSGGMGVVLKAKDRQLDELVAIKMLKSEVFTQDPAALERFKQELKLARRITHRHVVRTYDYSEYDNYYIISMEYVKGITLKQLIRQRGMLPIKIGLQIGKQICSGLDAAHERGVVHRDMKPQNILLENTGDAKIMDFGIARVADMKGMTSTGTVMGTPDYMSPEQSQGLPLDHRTDIYSTGVVLYEIFTGKLPFTADSALAVLNKHIHEQPASLSSLNPHVTSELEAIVLKAMVKNPDKRYQKISDLYADLDSLSRAMAPQERTVA